MTWKRRKRKGGSERKKEEGEKVQLIGATFLAEKKVLFCDSLKMDDLAGDVAKRESTCLVHARDPGFNPEHWEKKDNKLGGISPSGWET